MSGNPAGNILTRSDAIDAAHLMTSLVPGTGKRHVHFFSNCTRVKKNVFHTGPDRKLENCESVQQTLPFYLE